MARAGAFHRRSGRPAFTLLELLVAIAVIGVLIGLVLSAVQQARQSACRLSCASNLRQLALGLHHYHESFEQLPYAAKADQPGVYTWYHAVLPFVEQDAAYRNFITLGSSTEQGPWGSDPALQTARTTMGKVFVCPADRGLVESDLDDPTRSRARGSYRGCVGDGDVYGDLLSGGGAGVGMFQVWPGQCWGNGPAPLAIRLTQVSDGTSETILLSEGLTGQAGVPGDIQTGTMGGSLFSTREAPNTFAPDLLVGQCPQQAGDSSYTAPCASLGDPVAGPAYAAGATAAARSNHLRGVNAAFADGSVRFITADVSSKVWQAEGTRSGAEPAPEPVPATPPVTHVLFIGNSYTDANNLAGMVQSGWQTGPADVQRYVVGGATLQQLWNDGVALGLIRAQHWDYVVLQEQSQMPILDRDLMWYYARLFDREIRQSGGHTVFFMTWARSWWPQSQVYLTEAYQGIGRQLGATVAPVGLAWEASLHLRPDINLYQSDGSHPSQAGSALAASVFLAVLGGTRQDGSFGPSSVNAAPDTFLQQLGSAFGASWR